MQRRPSSIQAIILLLILLSACNSSQNQVTVREVRVVTEVRVEVVVSATPGNASEITQLVPTATPQKVGKVIVDNSILRSGPGHNFPVLEVIFKGEILTLQAKNQDGMWLFVLSSIGNKGWIPVRNIQSTADISDLVVSEEIISTVTISPTPTTTPSITQTLKAVPSDTPTPAPSMTKQLTGSPTPVSDQEYADFLVNKYDEYLRAYNKMINSSGTGADVKEAYETAQLIIEEISDRKVPNHMNELKDDLIKGISLQSKGFGCYSNKSLCESDAEATRLIVEGKLFLDKFINEYHDRYN